MVLGLSFLLCRCGNETLGIGKISVCNMCYKRTAASRLAIIGYGCSLSRGG